VNFLLGDLSERTLLYFIKQGLVGEGKLYSEVDLGEVLGTIHFQGKPLELYKQQDLVCEVPGLPPITAHVEGWGKRNADGGWELIECKSAADWGFKDFQNNGELDYLKQAHTCLNTTKAKELNADGVRYFYLRKQTGHIWDRYYSYNPVLWRETIADFKAANGDAEPPAPFKPQPELFRGKPTGRTVANFPCTYCPYLKKCHGVYALEWKGDQFGHQKPIYVFGGAT
jgi:hypothetical protein